eukprot:TRINITY_DN9403_c1_g2_i1.p2 TRINITY_DN9403_c1_g2~~TRINITY_DN9403_c1_g2_i1.p2  ORF type:complete len:102 (-),score=21.04 TRINITY_DN9403_c1_g2_i1:45-350(-)
MTEAAPSFKLGNYEEIEEGEECRWLKFSENGKVTWTIDLYGDVQTNRGTYKVVDGVIKMKFTEREREYADAEAMDVSVIDVETQVTVEDLTDDSLYQFKTF